MGSFPSRRAADWCVCTTGLYIGASRRLIGTRASIYRRVACNELRITPIPKYLHFPYNFFNAKAPLHSLKLLYMFLVLVQGCVEVAVVSPALNTARRHVLWMEFG